MSCIPVSVHLQDPLRKLPDINCYPHSISKAADAYGYRSRFKICKSQCPYSIKCDTIKIYQRIVSIGDSPYKMRVIMNPVSAGIKGVRK